MGKCQLVVLSPCISEESVMGVALGLQLVGLRQGIQTL